MRIQPWMLRAWALTWSPVVLLLLLAIRLSALDTAILGLPICVPFLLIIIVLFFAMFQTTQGNHGMATLPAFNMYSLLVLLPCNDLYMLLRRWDGSLALVVAFVAHATNTLAMIGGLVCLHRGLIEGVWNYLRMYFAFIALVMSCADLFLFHVTDGNAVEYPSPGGTDSLRSSLFTVAVALLAATCSMPRLRETFLVEWTAVPLSGIPLVVMDLQVAPAEAVQSITDRIAPSVRLAPSAQGLSGNSSSGAGALGGGAGAAVGRSASGAVSSRYSDESNSEILQMTTGLAAQRSAGEGLIGHAREASRDPEWDGPGFLPAGSSRASSRSSNYACASRADSLGADTQPSESRARGGGTGSERGEAIPPTTLEHRAKGGRRAAKSPSRACR